MSYSGRTAVISSVLITSSYSVSSLLFRSYRSVWRFVTVRDMVTLAITVAAAVALVGLVEVTLLSDDRPIPLSALLMGGAMSYLALTHLKISFRLQHSRRTAGEKQPVVVVGAGAAGVALARQLEVEPSSLRAVAFIDDDPRKAGRIVGGLPVVGNRSAIQQAVRRHRADAVAIAVPSATPETIRELSTAASDAGVRALVVPPLRERSPGERNLTLRELSLEDLFGRPEVSVDVGAIRAILSGKRVLVTGAAGSIGSELARQVARLDVEELFLLDNNETGLTDLRDELAPVRPCRLRVMSVTDANAMTRAFAEARPHVVLHAAAMKHVDIVEEQPHEAAMVNVLGTWNCARAAEAAGAERFLLISTDKAVAATNVLGASKRIGELIMASLATSRTAMFAVRFGNVVGSRGSAIPRFERQIAAGGPITVTHPDMHRYFMSIPEAVRLVLQAATVARSGHVYVLDMGEQVSISELATRLARIRGFRVPQDIDLVYTGLRPGERLREQLIQPGEHTMPTSHPQITELTEPQPATPEHWEAELGELGRMVDHDCAGAIRDRLLAVAGQGPDGASERATAAVRTRASGMAAPVPHPLLGRAQSPATT